jgi:hypothetical protein
MTDDGKCSSPAYFASEVHKKKLEGAKLTKAPNYSSSWTDINF